MAMLYSEALTHKEVESRSCQWGFSHQALSSIPDYYSPSSLDGLSIIQGQEVLLLAIDFLPPKLITVIYRALWYPNIH